MVTPSSAVTVAVIHVFGPATSHDATVPLHAPADEAYATVALTWFTVAVTSALVVPCGTSAVYDVVALTNAGASAPGAIARSISRASSDGCTVTSM